MGQFLNKIDEIEKKHLNNYKKYSILEEKIGELLNELANTNS